MLRISLGVFGLDVLDFCIWTGADAVDDSDYEHEVDGSGYTTSYPVGFYVPEVPEEVSAPQHCPSWDEPEE